MIINVATAAGTQNLWKQERVVLYLLASMQSDPCVSIYTNLHGTSASPIAKYTPCNDGTTYIDISDYVRAYPNVGTIYVTDEDSHTTYTINVQVKGLINPQSVIIPDHPLAFDGALIIPPSRLYLSSDHVILDNIEAEFYASNPSAWSVAGASLSVDKRNIGQFDGTPVTIQMTGAQHTINPIQVPCDAEYALVRWVSFTGETRCHILFARKQTISSANAYDLLPIDNEYIQIKGREDGFSLCIEGLNRYDYWYYSDILTSSKVEVSLDGVSFDRVQVTAKSVTIPDGEAGTDGKFEITINWKRYDAVAM